MAAPRVPEEAPRIVEEADYPPERAQMTVAELTSEVLMNQAFRRVLRTYYGMGDGTGLQQVAMCIKRGLAKEIHPANRQYFIVKRGALRLILYAADGVTVASEQLLREGQPMWVDPGTWHEVRNVGAEALALVAYEPPHHPPDRVDATAEAAEERERGGAELPFDDAEIGMRLERVDATNVLRAIGVRNDVAALLAVLRADDMEKVVVLDRAGRATAFIAFRVAGPRKVLVEHFVRAASRTDSANAELALFVRFVQRFLHDPVLRGHDIQVWFQGSAWTLAHEHRTLFTRQSEFRYLALVKAA